jgi:hypothetical protein
MLLTGRQLARNCRCNAVLYGPHFSTFISFYREALELEQSTEPYDWAAHFVK